MIESTENQKREHFFFHKWRISDATGKVIEPVLDKRTPQSIQDGVAEYRRQLDEYSRAIRASIKVAFPKPSHGVSAISVLSQAPYAVLPDDLVLDSMHELYNLFKHLGSLLFDEEYRNWCRILMNLHSASYIVKKKASYIVNNQNYGILMNNSIQQTVRTARLDMRWVPLRNKKNQIHSRWPPNLSQRTKIQQFYRIH